MLFIALGVWWNANTIAHHFIHRPFFRHRLANRSFGALLSVALGFPQSVWRERHLAHHAGGRWRFTLSREILLQASLVLLFWTALARASPAFFFSTYLPGYLMGLALCALHGHYEHAGGATSHYGALYNVLLFNDGFHVEHHAHPGVPWNRLPLYREPAARASRWPAPLRWIERLGLDSLERMVLRSATLQRFVVRAHARAFGDLLGALPSIDRVAIVGGGLFPRTYLALSGKARAAGLRPPTALLPSARFTIIDANADNLARARSFVNPARVELVHARYDPRDSDQYDLVVIPLSFDGDHAAIYAHPPAPAVIVHDWIWHRRGMSRVVSLALLKRVNLVIRRQSQACPWHLR